MRIRLILFIVCGVLSACEIAHDEPPQVEDGATPLDVSAGGCIHFWEFHCPADGGPCVCMETITR